MKCTLPPPGDVRRYVANSASEMNAVTAGLIADVMRTAEVA